MSCPLKLMDAAQPVCQAPAPYGVVYHFRLQVLMCPTVIAYTPGSCKESLQSTSCLRDPEGDGGSWVVATVQQLCDIWLLWLGVFWPASQQAFVCFDMNLLWAVVWRDMFLSLSLFHIPHPAPPPHIRSWSRPILLTSTLRQLFHLLLSFIWIVVALSLFICVKEKRAFCFRLIGKCRKFDNSFATVLCSRWTNINTLVHCPEEGELKVRHKQWLFAVNIFSRISKPLSVSTWCKLSRFQSSLYASAVIPLE